MTQWWLFLIVALGISTAHAQPVAEPDPATVAYQEGRRLYDLREWDRAIAKFKEAYQLRPEARSLFNIAQSFRLKGGACGEALGFYKTFKRNYPTEQPDKVDKFIAEMDACAKAAVKPDPASPVTPEPVKPDPARPVTPDPVTPDPAKPDAIKPDVTSTPPASPAFVSATGGSEQPPAPRADRSWMKWTGIAAMGVGVISLGLGTKFALDGQQLSDDQRDACATSCTSEQALAIEDKGKAANKRAVIAGAFGGVAIAGGIVLFVLSRASGETPPAVSITPTHGGAAASYSLAF